MSLDDLGNARAFRKIIHPLIVQTGIKRMRMLAEYQNPRRWPAVPRILRNRQQRRIPHLIAEHHDSWRRFWIQ